MTRGDITKSTLLDTGITLLQHSNQDKLSIDNICREIDLSKGSFYHHFQNKNEFTFEVLDYFFEKLIGEITKLQPEENDPLRRVFNFVNSFKILTEETVLSSGCLMGNFAQDAAMDNNTMRDTLKNYFEDWMKVLVNNFKEAQTKYNPFMSIDQKSLALFFVALLEGSILLDKVYQNKGIIRENLNLFNNFIGLLFANQGVDAE